MTNEVWETGYATLTDNPERIVSEGFGDLAACGYDGVETGLPKVQAIGRDRLAAALDTVDRGAFEATIHYSSGSSYTKPTCATAGSRVYD